MSPGLIKRVNTVKVMLNSDKKWDSSLINSSPNVFDGVKFLEGHEAASHARLSNDPLTCQFWNAWLLAIDTVWMG